MRLDPSPSRPLWWLPFGAAALPLLATAVAFVWSVHLGLVPGCNPFLDGCVSISRAARHGLPNIVFRALVLPAAVLQVLCWLLCPAWLRSLQTPRRVRHAVLPWLGIVAGASLILYASFLGTEGDGYRLLRRYGTALYFGFTCIGMLIVSGEVWRHGGTRHRRIGTALVALCGALPLLGLVHVLLPLALPGEATKDALQNVTEWWGGAIFTLYFFALAAAWRATRFAARLHAAPSE